MNDSREGSLSLGEKFALRVFALRCSNTRLSGPRWGERKPVKLEKWLVPLQANGPAPSSHPCEPGKTPNAPHTPPSTRWPRVSAAQLVALPASSQSHSPAALAVPELEVRNLPDPPPRARYTPTPCFLGRLTLPANLQITPSDERTGQRAEFACQVSRHLLPPVPPLPPTPLSRVSFFFYAVGSNVTHCRRRSAHLKALPVRQPDNRGLLLYFLPGLFAACHQWR